jgi:photosystem II stability/assembly factor-like uncharacterized protein
MTTLYVATDLGLAVVSNHEPSAGHGNNAHQISDQKSSWHVAWPLTGHHVQCVAVNPHQPDHLYCGTFDAGLWRSPDAGHTWQPVDANSTSGTPSSGLPHRSIMSLVVSPTTATTETSTTSAATENATVWAGTEPSAIFRSDDSGATWQEEPSLRKLPSAPTWSFPPRPYTSHVRWIQLDPHDPQRILASIEAGGVMCSEDGGATWRDRQRDTPRDAHGLAMHPDAPGRVYAASGDAAYAESADGGLTWHRHNDGLTYRYLWSVAVDPRDPNVVVVSASPSAFHAHRSDHAESALFRREGSGPWQQLSAGLPPAAGTMTYALATTADAFYAAPHEGDLYRSTDSGRTWEPLHIPWSPPAQPHPFPHVNALLALD